MDEIAFRHAITADPTNQELRLKYADWLEQHTDRREEALFQKMVARGLVCEHVWESTNQYLLGEEADLEIRPKVFRVLLKPGAWIQVCRICRQLRFDGPYQVLR